MADFFENIAPQVGVTVEQFRRLSGPEALQLYVSSLEKAKLSQQDMVFYMEAIASDSALLLPLLRSNGQGWRELGDEAQRAGAVMSDQSLAGARAFQDESRKLDGALKGLRVEMAEQLMPALTELNRNLADPDTQDGIRVTMGLLSEMATKVVELANEFFLGMKYADGFWDALFKYGATNPFRSSKDHLAGLQKELQQAKENAEKTSFFKTEAYRKADAENIRSLEQQVGYWQARTHSDQDKENALLRKNYRSRAPAAATQDQQLSPVKAAKRKPKGGKTEAEKQEAQAKQYLKTLAEQLDKTQQLTAYEKLMEDVKRGTVVLSGEQLDEAQGLATVIDMTKEMEKQRTENLARQNLLFETQERLLSRQQQYQLELATYGMGDQSASELRERVQLLQEHQAELRKLGADQANAMANADDSSDIERIQAIYADRLDIIRNAQSQELSLFDELLQHRRQKEVDWVSGARSAFGTYVENAQNLYQQTNQVVGNMLGGMEDALVEFAKNGKASFSDFANSVLVDLARIQARKAVVGLFGEAGRLFSGLGSYFGFADGGYTGPGGRMEPAGIVHRGEVVWSQQDVARAGGVGVVESMRRGLNGYASGGAVGLPNVVTSGAMASTSGSVTVNVPVSVTSAGGGGQASEGALAAMGSSLSKALTPIVQEIIAREQRPGGRLWSWANGRS